MAIAPRGLLVKSPSCDTPPKYGLLASVTPQTVADLHWTASGIEWEDQLCNEGLVAFIDECPPATGIVKPSERNNVFCHADPFIAVGSYDCSTGGRPANEAFEIARKRLLVWESFQVENTLWTGAIANGGGTLNPSFAFGNDECSIVPVDINPAGALDPVRAIGALEEALGDIVACGGTLHVPYELAAHLIRFHLLTVEDGTYFTPTGSKVILGHGYPGSGPANVAAAAGQTWVFATGPIVLVRSNVMMVPDQVKEAVNRNINNITVRAERFYSVGWSCALLAIRVIL